MIAETEIPDGVDQYDIDFTETVLGYYIMIGEHRVGAIEGVPGDIEYLMVEPPYQDKGVARAALNAFLSLSRVHDASEVTTNNVTHPAMEHILETEGFEERSDEMGWAKKIWKAFDLFVDGEISEKAVKELGIEVTDSGNGLCPEDDCDGTLQPTDDCSMCDECFYSPCQ